MIKTAHTGKGSTWKIWDFHLHSPYSILNNNFGDPENSETWDQYIDAIESKAHEKKIAAIGITDYFMIEGYKKLKQYQDNDRLKDILLIPNIEFRLDEVINVISGDRSNPKRLNLHVLFSPEVSAEDIEENFLHELDFVYEEDTFNLGEKRKLKIRNLSDLGKKRKSEHAKFRDKSDLFIGCMTAVVNASQIKDKLDKKPSIFKGKYLIVLAEEGLSLLNWDGQAHGVRKILMQMSQCVFSSNTKTRDFCLGKTHETIDRYIGEFKSLKPCVWGCDSHSLDERFLEPCSSSGDQINYCWIKSEVTWDGLKQILYEPEERIKIQENSPEAQKSIYTIDEIKVTNTQINPKLNFKGIDIDLNPNLVAIIGGRGSGKTALLDIIASCYKEGDKLEKLENSFFSRLYGKDNAKSNSPIEINLKSISGDEIINEFGNKRRYFEKSDIIYITQKHFEDLSSDYERLNEYVFKLIFSKFPDEKLKYDSFMDNIQLKLNNLQTINLSIQQLKNEIKSKDNLKILLKEKEGEKLDYSDRIRDIELKSKVSEDVAKISNGLFEAKNEKQKLESLLFRLEEVLKETNNVKKFRDQLSNFNQGIEEVFSTIPSEIEIFPDQEIMKLTDNLERISDQNKIALNNILINNDKKIDGYKDKLQEFTDINKTISDFKQKENSVLGEITEINLKLNELNKKEDSIKNLEYKRSQHFIEIINIFLESREFISSLLNKFETGKDRILDNIGFDAILILDDEKYITNISNKINHRSLSEEDIRSTLTENILNSLREIALNKRKVEGRIFKEITDNLIDVGNTLFSKPKGNPTYADFFNHIFQVPLKVKINIYLDEISLESLSMGQRAMVLLKIILAYDDKPLLIDQPEEDLDNRYIYEHLVEAFKKAKNKRQILIATHNANLAVNTDAEQIIVAKYEKGTISYELGTLENPTTKKDLKQILEGGDAAFRKREEKYGYIF